MMRKIANLFSGINFVPGFFVEKTKLFFPDKNDYINSKNHFLNFRNKRKNFRKDFLRKV